jgi:hypothetical protein
VLPGYTILQNTVRGALVFGRERLSGALEGLIDAEDARSVGRLHSQSFISAQEVVTCSSAI